MVAPCLPPSRTLRAGFAGAAGGILDGGCARRSGEPPVGTKGWSVVELRDGPVMRRRPFANICNLDRTGPAVPEACREHRAADRRRPQSSTVAVAAAAQF